MIQIKLYFSYNNKYEIDEILDVIKEYFESFTFYKGLGYYKGIFEKSGIIEIISTGNSIMIRTRLINLANFIKHIANQEKVLITYNKLESSELI